VNLLAALRALEAIWCRTRIWYLLTHPTCWPGFAHLILKSYHAEVAATELNTAEAQAENARVAMLAAKRRLRVADEHVRKHFESLGLTRAQINDVIDMLEAGASTEDMAHYIAKIEGGISVP
jgi:hypothetical protein